MRRLIPSIAILCSASAVAQDDKPAAWGPFETNGSATVGYRLTDISGRREKYLELFNMQSGFRLLDFDLSGNAKQGASSFADRFQLTGSGLGGDPFPTMQATASKSKAYDLRLNYRQTYYYWDRNDNAVQPSGFRGLTTNHNWATVRRFGSANLLVHATDRLKLRFEYGRNSRDGMNYTTRTLEYFGSSSTWGSFLRDNPYYVEGPIREESNRVSGGIDYTLSKWSFHYGLGYQTFDQALNWNNVNSPQRSISVDSAPTARELLTAASWSEFRTLKTPSSEFVYNGAVNSRLSLRGDFMYFRYRGPASLDASFVGTARTNSGGTAFAPYAASLGSRAQLTEPNYVFDQGFTVKLAEWSNFHVDYRYNRFTQHAVANDTSVANGTPFQEVVTTDWRQGLHQLDTNLEIHPLPSLIVRPGIRLVKRDVTAFEEGVSDPARSRRIKTVWPIASVAYLPSKEFSIRGDLQSITNGASYTRITPHTDVGTRWVVRYQPIARLSIEDNFVIRNRKLVDSDFRNSVRANGVTVSWAWNDRLSTFAGFSYDSFLATASVNFLRGTVPLNTTWRDQTVNRVWQAGISAQPLPRLGISFSGNYVRSTGAGEISGELPTFGPLKWPMATGTAYYDLPKLGRVAIDLQRTYYLEQIVTGNNFQANLLTIRWTRGF